MTAAPATPRPRLGLVAAIVAAVVLAGAVVAGVLILREGPAFALSTRPDRNVLLVTIDTLRGDALGSVRRQGGDAKHRRARGPWRALHVCARADSP